MNNQVNKNKPNTGALFRNEQKKGQNSPDYMGRVNINGHEMYLSGWMKTSKGGKPYMSLSLTEPPTQQQGQAPAPQQQAQDFF